MIMTDFLAERRTVRDYKDETLNQDVINKIKEAIDTLMSKNDQEGLVLKLYENGSIIYDELQGKAGYGGVMIKAPHYISVETKSDSENDLIMTGYYLEELNSTIATAEIGTAWITMDEVDADTKKRLFGENGEGVNYIMAVGVPQRKKLFQKEVVTPRKSVDELVFKDSFDTPASNEDLENLGLFDLFTSIRYAPSHGNWQPWRFLIKDNHVEIFMVRSDFDARSLVDIGVIMYYFEAMARRLGIERKWELIQGEDKNGLKPVASFKL